MAAGTLPPIHCDPLLIAQAQVEGMLLVTSDPVLGRYPGAVRVV